MTIVGENKTIIFDDTLKKKLALFNTLNDEKKITSYPSFSNEAPLSLEVSSFVDQIKNREKNYSSLKMGLDVVRVLSACEKSMKLNGKVIKIH